MAETTSGKGKKNKGLLIGLGVLALGGLIYFLMRKKGTSSTSVTINVSNYSASDYEPLTDAQIKSKVDEVNGLLNQLGTDETIKQLQSQIDSYMTDGSPESLAYAALLEDVISDIENQTKSTTSAVAPSNMAMGVPSMMMGVPSTMISGSPILTTASIDATKYPLLSNAQIGSELANANSLVASKGVDGAIAELNARTGALLSSTNPIDQQLGLLLNEIIRALGGIPLNTTLAPIKVISTNPTTTPSTNDLTAFVDPATRPTTTPTAPTLPQLSTSQFSTETYPLVPQTTLDSTVADVNASVLANGLATTISNLLAQATALDKSTLPAERELGKVYYDMAATLDILSNPANASKYTITGTQQSWREYAISRFALNTATPNLLGLQGWLYIKWATYGIDFTEPTQTQYRAIPYSNAKSRQIGTWINTNGWSWMLDRVIFNLTPLGKIINQRPAR
jgi:hypothetical protein